MRLSALALFFAFCVFASGLAFAGSCPAGDKNCFLCGGVDGIPCTTNCSGAWSEAAHAYVSCECPQGEPCVCHCPIEGGEAVIGIGAGIGPGSMGTLKSYSGEVHYLLPDGKWARVASRLPISELSTVRTGKDSGALLVLDDGSRIYMDENTQLALKELRLGGAKSTLEVIVELVKGAILSDVTKRDGTKFDVDCQVSVAGVKGTRFATYYDDAAEEATIKVLEGSVSVPDRFGRSEDVGEGQMVRVSGASGLGPIEEFDEDAEMARWDVSAGGCGPAFVLPLILCVAMAFRRSAR